MKAPLQKAKLFINGNSQAVRLPKEFRFKGKEVLVKKTRKGVLLMSVRETSDKWFKNLDNFTPDWMTERNQPLMQKRKF